MGQISGDVEVELERAGGEIDTITVDGSQFGLEEGGDWSRDRDDGELSAGFLFIAFCEGFDLMLSVRIHGNSVTSQNLSLRESDFEEFEIKRAAVTQDNLDVSGLFPAEDEDID